MKGWVLIKMNTYKLNILKKNLLSNYRTSLNSLVHIGLLTHEEAQGFILEIDSIIYLKKDKEKAEKEKQERKTFRKNNPGLVKEWEAYSKTQIQDGLNVGEGFFNWLVVHKKISYKEYTKEGLKEE